MNKYQKSNYDFSSEKSVSAIDELSLWSAPFGLKLLDSLRLRENMTVLDIGCGLGFPALEIAARLGGTGLVYGIDPWTAALKRAEEKRLAYSINNAAFIEGAAENIPLPADSVDLIVSNNGINNVADLPQVLAECRRVARNGAQFTAAVNLPDSMIEFYSVFKLVAVELGMPQLIGEIDAHIYKKRLPEQKLVQMFEDAGFTIFSTIHDSFKYSFINASTMFNYPLISYAFFNSWLELLPENQRDMVFSEIERRLNENAAANGMLTLSVPLVIIDARA